MARMTLAMSSLCRSADVLWPASLLASSCILSWVHASIGVQSVVEPQRQRGGVDARLQPEPGTLQFDAVLQVPQERQATNIRLQGTVWLLTTAWLCLLCSIVCTACVHQTAGHSGCRCVCGGGRGCPSWRR